MAKATVNQLPATVRTETGKAPRAAPVAKARFPPCCTATAPTPSTSSCLATTSRPCCGTPAPTPC